jgi:glutathione synthase
MDRIDAIHPEKDTTLALLLEAQRRGYRLLYATQGALAIRDGEAWGHLAPLTVRDDRHDWFTLGAAEWQPSRASTSRSRARIRQSTRIHLRHDGARIRAGGRRPRRQRSRGLRDCNEKNCSRCASRSAARADAGRARRAAELKRFVAEHGEVVLKPLDGMGGRSIFRSRHGDPNLNVILETLTGNGHAFAIAQKFIPKSVRATSASS